MAKGERYYWIKLKKSFLTSEKVDFLLSQANGSDYVVIYQMLCLKTINTGGELFSQIGEVIIPYDIPKIQRDLKHFSVDTITVALELFKRLGMVYIQENGILKITEFAELVGSESESAERVREFRARQKALQCNENVTDNVTIEYRNKSIENRNIDITSDRGFKPPTLDEIKAYIQEKNLLYVSAERFYNYYESIGWKVGKNKMKSWKAAISGWNARETPSTAHKEEEPEGDIPSVSMDELREMMKEL